MTGGHRRHAAGAALMFAANGAMFASLLPWYPTLVREWGLTEPQFGLIVAAMPLGSLVSSALPAAVVSRWGPVPAVVGGTAVMAALMASVGVAVGGGAALALVLFLFGIADATADVGQNVVGTRVQERSGRTIISSLHAFWSLGAALAGAIATWAATAGAPLRAHIAVAAAVSLAMAVAGARLTGPTPLADDPATGSADSPEGTRFTRAAVLAVLPVALVAIAGTAVEDAGQNWAALATHELAGVAVASAGVTYAAFLSAQTVGRFLGDRFVDAFGRVRVAVAGGALIAAGGALVVAAGSAVPMVAGFALAGFGCATLVPSAFAAAAALPGLSDGAGVTVVGWLMRLGFLATSPAIGAVAGGAGLRAALGLLAALGLIAMACAPSMGERRPKVGRA